MTPKRPYLVRAFYEWLLDNELTPHLVVDATLNGVRVPVEYIQDGQIVLNVAPRAVGNIEITNETIMFQARFGGRPHSVIIPIYAVQAIYARENGEGTMFEPEQAYQEMELSGFETNVEPTSKPALASVDSRNVASAKEATKPVKDKQPSLRVIK